MTTTWTDEQRACLAQGPDAHPGAAFCGPGCALRTLSPEDLRRTKLALILREWGIQDPSAEP